MWLSLAIILLGVLAGYVVGRESILHTTDLRLRDYADSIVQRENELSDELTDTLRQANASPYTACSPDDIVLLRRLTFVSRFLKDVGRIKDNTFLCSATSGQEGGPIEPIQPDIRLADEHQIYMNYPLHEPEGDHAVVVVKRTSGAVVSPDVLSEFSQQPIHFAVRVFNPLTRESVPKVAGGARDTPLPFPGRLRQKDLLTWERCSDHFPVCVTTSIHMSELWQASRGLLFGYMSTGTIAGVACAFTLLVAGSNGRSHTNQLKRAILLGKLSVVYQPIVELGDHRIVGAEALARWTDEDGASIRPETIIALADAEGFVSEITRFVLTRALEELREVFEANAGFQLNINLAPSDLADPRLLLLLDEKLGDGRVSAANLAFELPERATFDREVAITAIRRLRDRGHVVFIDDFGTGYSNLTYLSELDVDGIKINRSFIGTIGTESVTASIVPQILAVAQALDLKVVVQGIEREEQADYFASGDPHMLAQGWFFGLPVPARSLLFLCSEKAE
jgi:sensor c-di-GMP phosphodiesterase-like protein